MPNKHLLKHEFKSARQPLGQGTQSSASLARGAQSALRGLQRGMMV